jgi:xanthine/CO dehydrogenase XdhC/CoxF family maturation factor
VRLDTSLELLLAHGPAAGCVLATVVGTAGSTYRKPGARMFIFADGSHVGLLSGGCLEADLRLHAEDVRDSGRARAVEYDMRGPDDRLFGTGAGCEGAMRILLEPCDETSTAASALRAAGRATGDGVTACLVSVHESTQLSPGTYHRALLPPSLVAAAEACLAAGVSRDVSTGRGAERLRAFVEFLAPSPHLLVCGAGPDAQPVAAAARAVGWRLTVVDHRPAYADPRRFPGARVIRADPAALAETVDLKGVHAAVVMSHHFDSDVRYLRAIAAAGEPGYVGLLGPLARRRRIARELGELAEPLAQRLKGPVGMDIGAVTPEGIALAIVAEVHGWLAGPLRRELATAEASDLFRQEA